jgi:hypothetical protein
VGAHWLLASVIITSVGGSGGRMTDKAGEVTFSGGSGVVTTKETLLVVSVSMTGVNTAAASVV